MDKNLRRACGALDDFLARAAEEFGSDAIDREAANRRIDAWISQARRKPDSAPPSSAAA